MPALCDTGVVKPNEIDISSFLVRWRGRPSVAPGVGDLVTPEVSRIPAELREWYALTSCFPEVRTAGVEIFEPSRIRMDGDKVVFMKDPTGDWFWAFDNGEPGIVYEGRGGGRWSQLSEDLADLLVHVTVKAAISLATFGRLGSQVPDESLFEVLSPVDLVEFGGWRWPRPGHQIFVADNLLIETGPAVDLRSPWLNRAGYSTVRVAGLDASDLEYLDADPSISWIEVDGESLE